MAVTRADKEQELQDLTAAFKARHRDPGGLQGAERSRRSRSCAGSFAASRASYKVVKNTLAQAGEHGHDVRGAREALRGHDRDRLHRRRPGGAGQDADHVHEGRADAVDQGAPWCRAGRSSRRRSTDLANLPGKPELYAKLLFLLQAPMQQFVSVLAAAPRDLMLSADAGGEEEERSGRGIGPSPNLTT